MQLESCASSQPKVIRLAAAKALDTACASASSSEALRVALAPSLAKLIEHKNRDVQTNAMSYTCE